MATMAASAPLLAFGPPGWLAYAVIGVGGSIIVGALVHNAVRDDTRAVPITGTSTRECRGWSVRIHAQGIDCGGRTTSTIGAPAYQSTQPITIAEGIMTSNATWALLTRRQKTIRESAKTRLETYITRRPPVNTEKTFPATDPSGGKRYDIGNYGCSPNFLS